ncbi:MAG: pseudaminic acid synthase [Candidatus Paceibacterota bacterium]|jgi:pseudaminic acid synthase
MPNQFKIGKRIIGKNQPVFIVAEMSGNHNRDYKKALKIIDAAAEAGADAVKLQTYTPDTITINSDQEWFKVKTDNLWAGKTLYDLYKWAYTPWEWHAGLKKYAEKRGLIFFSTPFDETAVDFLEKLSVPLYKVASFEIPHIPLLKKIGQTQKPVIISRGLASPQEIRLAIKTLKSSGAPTVAVLHCVSSYPATADQMNLATIADLAKKFKVVSGLSDHSLGTTSSVAGVALGACIIEKHLTLKRSDGGPDAEFSLEPTEFKELVDSIRQVEKAIGRPCYKLTSREKQNIVFRRSLFVVKDIKKGEKFSKENVRCIRPGYGLAPKYLNDVLGSKAKSNIKFGTPLSWHLIKK